MSYRLQEIQWERIWCTMRVRTGTDQIMDPGGCLALLDDRGRIVSRWQMIPDEEGLLAGRMNLSNPGGGRCLPAGIYTVSVVPEDPAYAGPFHPETVFAEDADEEQLREAGRRFLYGDGSEAYTASFLTAVGALKMRVGAVRLKKPAAGILPAAKRIYRYGMRHFLRRYYLVCRKPGNKKTVLFFTEQNASLGSNLLALKERMKKRGLDREVHLDESCRISVTDRHLGFASWMRVVKKLAQADLIFMDDHAPVLDWLKLSPETTVIQCWHAGIGFKASGYSRWGHLASPPPFSCHRQYTWGITGSEKTRGIFAEIWGLDEERVLPLGMPRLDAQLDPVRREAVRARLWQTYPDFFDGSESEKRKIILFAPTYRGKNRKSAGYPYEKIDFSALYEACGSKWAVIFKMHPWVKEEVPVPAQYRDRFLDLGGKEPIEDLYAAADLLITDYSSDIYDFAVHKKPMLFYAFDEEEYAIDRGFHLDYEASAPGRVARSFSELVSAVRREDFQTEKADAYRERNFDHLDGHACDRIIDFIGGYL